MEFKKGVYWALIIALIQISSSAHAMVTPYFSIRSQSENAARRISGMTNIFYQYSSDNVVYGTLSIAPEYTRTFNSQDITDCLFDNSLLCKPCESSIAISGSRSPDRGNGDWLADYFYLPTDFSSIVTFKPIIDNFIIDFEYYVQFDAWVPGLYFQLSMPLTHSRWDLRMHEEVINCGTHIDDYGYFSPQKLTKFLDNFTQYANGCSIDPIIQNLSDNPAVKDEVVIVAQPLLRAQMSSERLIRTRVADLRMFFGWDYIFCENQGHFGLDIQAAAPTGNAPKANYLFEPIVGNGNHWELGGGVHGLIRFAQSEDYERSCCFYAEANVTHLFKTKQRRTFDLCGKPMSRYMLAQRMKTKVEDNLVGVQNGNEIAPTAQFGYEYAPVANLSSVDVSVSAAVQADIVALFNLTRKGFTWDIGYNFWGKTCDSIGCPEAFDVCDKWSLKGDAAVFGYESNVFGSEDLLINSPVALSATQSEATIHSGLNFPSAGAPTPVEIQEGRRNPRIDNPLPARAQTNLTAQPGTMPNADRIKTSVEPEFFTASSLSTQAGRTKGISSKVFTHLQYLWCAGNGWQPYLGVGGEAEFGHQSKPFMVEKCCSCLGCAVSQWGIWFKGGVVFN